MRLRPVAALACAALVGAGGLWALAARADDQSDALIQKARKAEGDLKTLQGELSLTVEGPAKQALTFNLSLMKPNLGRIKLTSADGQVSQSVVSDGKDLFIVLEMQKQYVKRAASAKGEGLSPINPPAISPIAAFFNPELIGSGGQTKYVGKETVDGKPYEVVQLTATAEPKDRKLYFGASGLLEGVQATAGMGEMKLSLRMWLKNLKTNAELKAEQFAFTPPAGFKVFEPPKQPDFDASLLAVGKDAPDFLLPQPGGTQLALSNTLKDKKAVLINFWFYN